jgi:hypothetical protein
MPADFGAKARKDEILTPLCPLDIATLETWANASAEQHMDAAEQLFPWWEEGFGGAFYRGIALHSFWMELRWATPLDKSEAQAIERTVNWGARALQLEAELSLPKSAMDELRALMSGTPQPFANPEGIGYRRRQFSVVLGDWTFEIPGSLVQDWDSKDKLLFESVGFEGSATAATLDPEEDAEGRRSAPGEVKKERGFWPADDGEGFVLDAVARTPSADGPDRLCMMKIWMVDEALRAAAEAIADSVTLLKSQQT